MKMRSGLTSGMQMTTLNICGRPLCVEIARNTDEQAQGLKYRHELPADAGMLFEFGYPRRVGFHMTDTALPLDVGFITTDGILREVRVLQPFSSEIVNSFRDDIQYALEVNQGWFSAFCGV